MTTEDKKRERTGTEPQDELTEDNKRQCKCAESTSLTDLTRVYLDDEHEDELLLLEADPDLSAAFRRAFSDTYTADPCKHILMADIFIVPVRWRKSVTYTPKNPYKMMPGETRANPLLEYIPDLDSHTYTITRLDISSCQETQSFLIPCYNWHIDH